MKSLFITITAVILSIPAMASAQNAELTSFRTGTMFIGGEVSFSDVKTEIDTDSDIIGDDKTDKTKIKISPVIGYFLNPNIALWGQLTFEDVENESRTYGVMVGLDYYVSVSPRVFLYVGAGVGFAKGELEDDETKIQTYIAAVHGGVLFMLNKHVGFNAGLSFKYLDGESESDVAIIGKVESDVTSREIGAGYFGVKAFF
ncbi:porin family protein [Myxococcota bacterium]|nr:porin family protein [Myxococcota bacterium]MBU1382471.1 porin family protein [Myxococcota bacterium]MBU1498666.1 porin family protein [Myxococcota bacterium]